MLKVIDPSRGTPLHEFPIDDSATVERILKTAAETFKTWRETTFAERGAVLKNVAQYMRDNIEPLPCS
jgi:succinate-semialdehyde dehydrogenase / glutarate-semialdehyde dehydrogenase